MFTKLVSLVQLQLSSEFDPHWVLYTFGLVPHHYISERVLGEIDTRKTLRRQGIGSVCLHVQLVRIGTTWSIRDGKKIKGTKNYMGLELVEGHDLLISEGTLHIEVLLELKFHL